MEQLKRWRCHKVVRAGRIRDIRQGTEPVEGGSWELLVDGYGTSTAVVSVPYTWFVKHDPKVGGYYVVYEGGYASFSPADAFVDGYTQIEEEKI